MHDCQLALRVHEHSVENSIASYPRWLGMQEAIKYCCVYNESVIWRCVQDVAAAAATEETAVRGGGWGAGGGVVSVRTIIINIIRNLSCHHHHQHNHRLHQKHHHHHRQQRRHHHRQHHHHLATWVLGSRSRVRLALGLNGMLVEDARISRAGARFWAWRSSADPHHSLGHPINGMQAERDASK